VTIASLKRPLITLLTRDTTSSRTFFSSGVALIYAANATISSWSLEFSHPSGYLPRSFPTVSHKFDYLCSLLSYCVVPRVSSHGKWFGFGKEAGDVLDVSCESRFLFWPLEVPSTLTTGCIECINIILVAVIYIASDLLDVPLMELSRYSNGLLYANRTIRYARVTGPNR
jgi:hypothetical protein